jgi:hypothetical protein
MLKSTLAAMAAVFAISAFSVIETAVHVLQEVIDRNRRLLAIQLQLDVASRSGRLARYAKAL